MTTRVLLAVLVATAPLAGCLATSQPDGGVVVTGQPLADAFLVLDETDRLAGIPAWTALDEPIDADRVGRPFTIDAESVLRLEPALVLDQPHPLFASPGRSSLEADVRAGDVEYRQVTTEPQLSTVRASLDAVADATDASAEPAWRNVTSGLEALNASLEGVDEPTALVLFPAGLTAGSDTHVDVVLDLAGLENAAAEAGLEGYRQITDEAVQRADLDLVVATSTRDETPAEIAAKPMFEDTPIEDTPERVLVVDPSRTTLLGPHVHEAARMLATWTHDELGPRIHASVTPLDAEACGTLTVDVDAPNATVDWLGETHDPGTVPVPDVEEGHYRLHVTAEDGSGTARVTQLVTVEGSTCDA